MTNDEWLETFTAVLELTLVPRMEEKMRQIATDAAMRALNARDVQLRRDIEDILAQKRIRFVTEDD